MIHNCGIGRVVNVWIQGVSYDLDSSQEASINQRQYSNNDDIFALNVLGITVLQFAITFGGTNLFILVQQISEWIKGNVVILWISCAIYLVLQTIWMYVPALARKYPYNVMYLILMIVLVIAGAITFPLTVFKLLFEMKMVFGGGTFRYHQMDLVLAAGILYNCWWNLFLTLMWLCSMTGLRNLNSTNATTTNTTLLNVQSSIDLVVLTKLD
ncbi:unnamed protein product [Schistosoma margrebowiei]|uniref:Transmembrane protein n=1 Tax=Schistosoma margrebowiei TaxID=48269 RepID=A0AA84ZB33_9TREM|nr:unnamed protein product [Schistosoma margrebowiei]